MGYARGRNWRNLQGMENWILGINDGLGIKDDECPWTWWRCGILRKLKLVWIQNFLMIGYGHGLGVGLLFCRVQTYISLLGG